jgi:hypothetical protein
MRSSWGKTWTFSEQFGFRVPPQVECRKRYLGGHPRFIWQGLTIQLFPQLQAWAAPFLGQFIQRLQHLGIADPFGECVSCYQGRCGLWHLLILQVDIADIEEYLLRRNRSDPSKAGTGQLVCNDSPTMRPVEFALSFPG